MIRLVGTKIDGTRYLVLGVDDENVRRLTSGKPIKCEGKTCGLDVDVYVVHGHTLADVQALLLLAGLPIPQPTTPPGETKQ